MPDASSTPDQDNASLGGNISSSRSKVSTTAVADLGVQIEPGSDAACAADKKAPHDASCCCFKPGKVPSLDASGLQPMARCGDVLPPGAVAEQNPRHTTGCICSVDSQVSELSTNATACHAAASSMPEGFTGWPIGVITYCTCIWAQA